MPWGTIDLGIDDYHFYHFSHRLPLKTLRIATDCNGLQKPISSLELS